jgi:hypothetical protein
MSLDDFFVALWRNYTAVTPQAERIHDLIRSHNGVVINDHVAFRTLDQSPINLDALQPAFERLGYQVFDDYKFPSKNVRAKAFLHHEEYYPKVFLSELQVAKFSGGLQSIIKKMLLQAEFPPEIDERLFLAGCIWPRLNWQDYQALLAESEYAAWLSVMGFRANHFTVSVNHLHKSHCLDEIVEMVQSLGLSMNESGGLIKGNALVGLQQAATLADSIECEFADGEVRAVPTCYYEFSLRYPDARGNLYQGFVADSADKIFESTHQQLSGMS